MVRLDIIRLQMKIVECWGSNYSRKDSENKLRWLGHVEKRVVGYVVRRVDHIERSQTTRGRKIPKKLQKKY